MSLKLTYHKVTALLTATMLLWNIAGWLATGLVLNHTHHGSDTHLCEVAFCYCETNEGETICTCHHNSSGQNSHAHGNETSGDLCYFTDGQAPQTAASHLIVTTNLTALYFFETTPIQTLTTTYMPGEQHPPLLLGVHTDLLRPPQV